MGAQGEEVGQLSNGRKCDPTKHLDGDHPGEGSQVQFHTLHKTGEVGHDQNALVLVAAQEGQNLVVIGLEKV